MTYHNSIKPLPVHLKLHRSDIVNSLRHENGAKYDLAIWKKAFAGNATILKDLAVIGQKCTGIIKRGDIRKLVTTALNSHKPSDIRIVFLASQIWGWGNRGIGINNTKRCLSEKNAENILVDSFNKVRGNQIGKAYNNFKLPRCGPAFFTKFFYFIGLALNTHPLPVILDTQVAIFLEFLGKQEGWDLSDFALVNRNRKKNNTISSIKRYEKGYIEYIKCMGDWATKLGCNADDIEYYMYKNARSINRQGGSIMGKSQINISLPADKMAMLSSIAEEYYGEEPEIVAKVWIIDKLLPIFGSQGPTNIINPALPDGPLDNGPKAGCQSANASSLQAVKQQLANKYIKDPDEKRLFEQTTRFKQWANYIAGLVLTENGKTPFTPRDIREILSNQILPNHYGKSGALENEVLTADVRVDAPGDSPLGFPCLEQIKRGLYKFIGFREGIRKRYGDRV